jgi:hypothetical protein
LTGAQAADLPPYNRQITGSSPVPPTGEVAVVSPLTCINAGRETISWFRPRWRSARSPQNPQLAPGKPPAHPKRQARPGAQPGRAELIAGGTERAATRGGGGVITLECGITVYPARSEGDRWRAVWYEDGRREQCEAPSEKKLAAKLDKVKIRLEADAPKMRQPGAALIAHYLDPDLLSLVPAVQGSMTVRGCRAGSSESGGVVTI